MRCFVPISLDRAPLRRGARCSGQANSPRRPRASRRAAPWMPWTLSIAVACGGIRTHDVISGAG